METLSFYLIQKLIHLLLFHSAAVILYFDFQHIIFIHPSMHCHKTIVKLLLQTVKNTVFNNGLNDKLQHISLVRLFLHFDPYLDPTAKAVKNNFGVFPDIRYLLFHRNNIMAFNSITENP